MNVLFVHQNFPGQYLHVARHLGAIEGNKIAFITQRTDADLPGVTKLVYKPGRQITRGVHHYLIGTEAGVLNAQNVARVAMKLRESGFMPDVMLAHNGWGEPWYLKDVYPEVPLIGYFEFFYHRHGADVGFEPGPPLIFDAGPKVRTKNIGNLLALNTCDYGQAPTKWQKSLYPKEYQSKIHIVHEGIDTANVAPNPEASFAVPDTDLVLTPNDEVVTYVARNLEPYRGFPSFMRSLPAILSARPNAHVLVVGGDEVSYGSPLADGRTYRQQMMEEVGKDLDLSRVHFLGKVPYSRFVRILQVSSVHIYLTYPFVLSWSMMEAMSAGCLIVGSRTQPVEELIKDGENGVLVDIFKPEEISAKAIDALARKQDFVTMRAAARKTIVEQYDLRSICLPAQLRLMNMAARGML